MPLDAPVTITTCSLKGALLITQSSGETNFIYTETPMGYAAAFACSARHVGWMGAAVGRLGGYRPPAAILIASHAAPRALSDDMRKLHHTKGMRVSLAPAAA